MNSALRNSAAHVFVDSVDAPALGDVDAHHLLRVLRVKPCDVVTVSDGVGSWRTCVVDGDAKVEVTSDVVVEPSPKWKLTIAFSVVKGDRPEWTVQKLTEIGIDEIIVLAPTTRSVVRWDAGSMFRHHRAWPKQDRHRALPVRLKLEHLSPNHFLREHTFRDVPRRCAHINHRHRHRAAQHRRDHSRASSDQLRYPPEHRFRAFDL
ncbi:MAG: RsmE family RNA methyltransferase [Acidimicrobiia bacterium]|nr:RsmE family RNA methyltransferase [Acidimicrobiia bacterium]